jgi:hypothetical protein
MRVEFHGLRLDLPQGWTDITDDLPEGSPPSLARPMGVGAIQFSFARFQSGEEPTVTVSTLQQFVEEFFQRNGITLDRIVAHSGRIISAEGVSSKNGEHAVVRYFSNGRDIVQATYLCHEVDNPEMKEDLNGVEAIMDSVEF